MRHDALQSFLRSVFSAAVLPAKSKERAGIKRKNSLSSHVERTEYPCTESAPHAMPLRYRAMAAPWEYLIAAGVGAYVGNKIPQLEAKLLDDINAMRADRNMPPVSRVGGHSFGSSMTSDQSEDA